MSQSVVSSKPSLSRSSRVDQRPSATIRTRPHGRLVRALPNVIIFGLLAAVLAFGHHSGWKMPKASELFGPRTIADADWCSEHLVPESACIECQDDLFPKAEEFGFCRAHGVAECVNCHPELAQVKGSPQLPRYDTTKPLALVSRPENNSRNTLNKSRVQFTSAESADRAGVDVDVVQEHPMIDTLTANGELVFDPTRVAHLSAKAPGTVAHVFKAVGDTVQPGDILALVDAGQVGQAKSQLLHAAVQLQLRRANAERMRRAQASISERSMLEAETDLQDANISYITARQSLVNLGFETPEDLEGKDSTRIAEELHFLGISPAYLAALPTGTKTANLIPVRAPYPGVIVSSDVVAGEVVNTSATLFTVADPDRIWLTLSVRQEDAKYVTRGLPVRFQTDDGAQSLTGHVAWVSPAVDERTRTLQARVNLADQRAILRDKTFGTGQIILRSEPYAVVVPREAVQSTSDANFVFVRDRNYLNAGAPKVFHVRQVRIGAKDEHYVELLAGALPGEVIATKGSPVLLAQVLRSNLGAGCGCHDH
jgi:membrane fusion protein, heavy metal efflux system